MSGEGLIKSFRFRGNYCRDFFFFFSREGRGRDLNRESFEIDDFSFFLVVLLVNDIYFSFIFDDALSNVTKLNDQFTRRMI